MKKNDFTNFVGIDVSKQTLDVCFISNKEVNLSVHQQYSNDAAGIRKMLGDLKKRKEANATNTLFCLEHTGIYGRELVYTLFEKQWFVWVENPVAILRSIGLQRGKNDKVDATRIALYALKNNEKAKLWEAPRKEVAALRQLLNVRDSLIKGLKALTQPINEYEDTGNKKLSAQVKALTKNAVRGMEKDIERAEQAIDELIKSDAQLSRLFGLLTSIPAIGKITSAELVCATNEFKNYTEARQLACYCGVAPFEHSSGISIRGKTRVSNMANKKLKTKLHLCAIVAIQHDAEIKKYYERKVAEGKNKMSVINAVRNKLVHRIAAVVKRQTPFVKIAA